MGAEETSSNADGVTPSGADLKKVLEQMEDQWSRRARLNARKYIDLENWKTKEQFDKSGLADAERILEGLSFTNDWIVLEIGIGVGRIARHLANIFREVCGVDISSEMVRLAKEELREFANIRVLQNSGTDLSMFSDNSFHMAYSVKVFQHLPKIVFLSYLDEVSRVLKPSGLLKFQIFERTRVLQAVPKYWLRNLRHGHVTFWQDPPDGDTWVARAYSRPELKRILTLKGFETVIIQSPSRLEDDLWVTARVRK